MSEYVYNSANGGLNIEKSIELSSKQISPNQLMNGITRKTFGEIAVLGDLKEVENSKNLYTFLNSSFTPGGDVLKKETTHLLTMVLLNREHQGLKEFSKYVSGKGQKIVSELGFKRI